MEQVNFPSVADFYPEIQNDLTRVKWAHGVDSKKKLNRALQGKTNINMFKIFIVQILRCFLFSN